MLAARYGGDPASVDFRHLGRAAGFTNRKAEHAVDGRYPWVRVVEAKGRVTPEAEAVVEAAETRLREREAQRAAAWPRGWRGRRARGRRATIAGSFLERETARLGRRYGVATDWSRAEAAAARRMALAGFPQADVEAALAARADVRRRKAGHVADYARRTAAWAFGGKVRRPR